MADDVLLQFTWEISEVESSGGPFWGVRALDRCLGRHLWGDDRMRWVVRYRIGNAQVGDADLELIVVVKLAFAMGAQDEGVAAESQ